MAATTEVLKLLPQQRTSNHCVAFSAKVTYICNASVFRMGEPLYYGNVYINPKVFVDFTCRGNGICRLLVFRIYENRQGHRQADSHAMGQKGDHVCVCRIASRGSNDSIIRCLGAQRQEDANKQAEIARADGLREQQEAAKFRTNFEKDREVFLAILEPLNENIHKLSLQDREKVQGAVSRLQNVDDIRTNYPELFKKMDNATTLSEFEEPAKEVLVLNTQKRVLNTPECAGINLKSFPKTSDLAGIEPLPSPSAALSYRVQPDGIIIEFGDASNDADLENGYSIRFSDGKEIAMPCEVFRTKFICKDKDVFKNRFTDFQTKLVSRILSPSRTYDVPSAIAKNLQKTFSCLVP
ncbi:hypothetical protein [Rhizobium gallicum]|uniref:hypothetical protein n=1 Tax=Rhizobium gallicum TaxID=56730 RepID=UPI001EF96C24|nr:hypothetical protein [Rhizobium gallicum]ULJ73000.1 hypothetical protein L2W42_04970 [Rhizobium gallicum]